MSWIKLACATERGDGDGTEVCEGWLLWAWSSLSMSSRILFFKGVVSKTLCGVGNGGDEEYNGFPHGNSNLVEVEEMALNCCHEY